MIQTKRIYEEPDPADGYRVLTERLWPRGVSRERAALDRWMKEIAPSHKLRKWFDHDPQKWEEFREAYRKELYGSNAVEEMMEIIRNHQTVTLIYASRNKQFNSTVELRNFLIKLIDSSQV